MFENIQVGDSVVIGSKIHKVTHVTPKRFKVGEIVFKKSDGCEIGDNNRFATLLDVKQLNEKATNLESLIKSIRLDGLTDYDLVIIENKMLDLVSFVNAAKNKRK